APRFGVTAKPLTRLAFARLRPRGGEGWDEGSVRCERDAGRLRLRRRSAEALEQPGFARLRFGEMPLLHVPVAANVLRNRREADRELVVVRRKLRQQLVDQRFVLADQRAFALALVGLSEDVERTAAETTHLREHAKRRQHPRSVR